MKELIKKPANISRIEFWAVTTFFVFGVFAFITPAVQRDVTRIYPPYRHEFESVGVPFLYYRHFFVPQLVRYVFLFLSFLLLNFVIVPKLARKEDLGQNIVFVVLLFILGGAVFGTTDTYMKNYLFQHYKTQKDTYNAIFLKSYLYFAWILLLFGFYTVMKYAILHLLSNLETLKEKYRFVTQEGLIAFILWMVSMFLLLAGQAEGELIICWAILGPFGIFFYWYALHSLLPTAMKKRKPFQSYFWKAFLLLLVSILPIALLFMLLTYNSEVAFGFGAFNAFVHLLLTTPLSWIVFRRQLKGNEEVVYLKRELGKSTANFDFLRSQINPHFLFNALNTIYGTAIQEKAERTSEGIEKLGDMMRFMLQENMQEKISLAREIDYLNNYISLQRLRTDTNPVITIQAAIEEPVTPVQIAPMLLIPFVENAFKHGISLREQSHIKITLEMKGSSLLFDVSNSKHAKQENDPEKDKSGIGLNNVKQRLQLLYAGRHELIIRETGKDYFVHLTIQLA